jgi:hypothetical protein
MIGRGAAAWSHRYQRRFSQWVECTKRNEKQSFKETRQIEKGGNAMNLRGTCFWPKFASKGSSNESAAPKAVNHPKFFPGFTSSPLVV